MVLTRKDITGSLKLAVLVAILAMCVVDFSIADLPRATGQGFNLTDANDYQAFVDSASAIKWVLALLFSTLAGLIVFTHKVQMSAIVKVCELNHRVVDSRLDDHEVALNDCCPRRRASDRAGK